MTVNGQKLATMDKFVHLGSTLSPVCTSMMRPMLESQRRDLCLDVYVRQCGNAKERAFSTKLSVYKAIVLTIQLHASETWTVYQRHTKKLNRFHLNCLWKLLRVRWQDKVTDTEILEQTGMSSIFTMLRKTQLRWAGHVVRMPDEFLPKCILYVELQTEACCHGGQKKPFKDTLRASLKD